MLNFIDSPPLPEWFCLGTESDESAPWVQALHATADHWRTRAEQRTAEFAEADDADVVRVKAEAKQAAKIACYLDLMGASCLLETISPH